MTNSTLSGELDGRPGNYYVISHRAGSDPSLGYHRLAGPWPTHKQADDEVAKVRAFAEQFGTAEAHWQHFITGRIDIDSDADSPKSRLGDTSVFESVAEMGAVLVSGVTRAEFAVLRAFTECKPSERSTFYLRSAALRSVVERAAQAAQTWEEVERFMCAGLASRGFFEKSKGGRFVVTKAGRAILSGGRVAAYTHQ